MKIIETEFSKELSSLFLKHKKKIECDKNGIYIFDDELGSKFLIAQATVATIIDLHKEIEDKQRVLEIQAVTIGELKLFLHNAKQRIEELEKGNRGEMILIDKCYDAISQAIYYEDGLDGSKGFPLLEEIENLIGETENIISWKNSI